MDPPLDFGPLWDMDPAPALLQMTWLHTGAGSTFGAGSNTDLELGLGISLSGFLGKFRRSCNVGWHAGP